MAMGSFRGAPLVDLARWPLIQHIAALQANGRAIGEVGESGPGALTPPRQRAARRAAQTPGSSGTPLPRQSPSAARPVEDEQAIGHRHHQQTESHGDARLERDATAESHRPGIRS